MTAPSYQSTTVTDFTSDATSHAADIPATVNDRDLLLAIAGFDASSTTITTPTDWVNLIGVGGDPVAGVYAKVADGSEAGGTVDFVTSNSQQGSVHVIRATTWAGNINKIAVCNSFSGIPAILGMAPSAISRDYMVVVAQVKSTTTAWGTGPPTGYSNNTKSGVATDSLDSASIASATKTISSNQTDANPLWNVFDGLPAFLVFVSPADSVPPALLMRRALL